MIVPAADCGVIRKLCQDKILVATAGTFDLLHIGHVAHLEYCRKFGDYLAILMSNDAKVCQKKGPKRPIIPQDQRAKMLDSLKIVDFVVIGFNPQPNLSVNLKALEFLRPNVFITRNPTWEQDKETLTNWGIKLIIEPDRASRLTSTTEIIQTILERHGCKNDLNQGSII